MFAKAVRASVRAAASPRQLVVFLSEGGHLREMDPTSTSFLISFPPSVNFCVMVTNAEIPRHDQSRKTFNLLSSRFS